MLEVICAALIFDLAGLVLIALLFRAKGWRLPQWAGPKWLVNAVNRIIRPDAKRFTLVFG